jgi:hypothetical protein
MTKQAKILTDIQIYWRGKRIEDLTEGELHDALLEAVELGLQQAETRDDDRRIRVQV